MLWEAWYAVYGYGGREVAVGPYPTRKAAERVAAAEFYANPVASVRVTFKPPAGVSVVGRFDPAAA